MSIPSISAPRPMIVGLCLALLGILFGFILGGVFGAAEDSLKGYLNAEGQAVLATVYEGDAAAMEGVVNKSWSYFKRAHMHAGAIGTSALACILMLLLLCRPGKLASTAAIAFGIGSILYPVFWLWAGCIAPGMGSTGAAKEALNFIAIPGAGGCIIGAVLALVCLVRDRLLASGPAA
jgi:hypothetical protein